MSGIEITRVDMSASELRAASAKAPDARSARRMLALALVLEGVDRKTAAETCGMDRQTLRDWVHRYNADGLSGLTNRSYAGPPRRLSADALAELARLVETGPDPETDGVVRWRRVDLQRVIEERFGVAMHERTVGKQLKALGFVKLTARAQHPKSDPEVQEAFKKTSPTRSQPSSRKRPAENLSKSGSRMKHASASRAR
jgi:transposase